MKLNLNNLSERKTLIKLLLRIGINPMWIFDHIEKTTPNAKERLGLRHYFIELMKEIL